MKKLLRILLLVINLLFAMALLLSTMAGWVRPSRCMWFSYLSYFYFPLLVGNVFFALVWLCCGRKEFLVSVLAIVLRCSLVPTFVQLKGTDNPGEAAEGKMQIGVMSYNVHHFQGDGTQSADSNAAEFVKLVRTANPDILCLQEFPVPGKVRVNDSLKAMGYRDHFSVRTTKEGYHYGTTVYSKLPIEYVGGLDDVSKFYIDIAANDSSTVRVFCAHFDSYRLEKQDMDELDKMTHGEMDEETRNTIEKFKETIGQHETEWDALKDLVADCELPIIFAGDLNDTPSSYLYQRMREDLKDSWVDCGKGLGATYHGILPALRIDYILYSGKLKTTGFKRIKSDISDHYPVMAYFEL